MHLLISWRDLSFWSSFVYLLSLVSSTIPIVTNLRSMFLGNRNFFRRFIILLKLTFTFQNDIEYNWLFHAWLCQMWGSITVSSWVLWIIASLLICFLGHPYVLFAPIGRSSLCLVQLLWLERHVRVCWSSITLSVLDFFLRWWWQGKSWWSISIGKSGKSREMRIRSLSVSL